MAEEKRSYATRETKFKLYCAEKGYTADYVSDVIGCSKSTIYKYWRGERHPNRKTMKKMEAVLSINSYEMFGL